MVSISITSMLECPAFSPSQGTTIVVFIVVVNPQVRGQLKTVVALKPLTTLKGGSVRSMPSGDPDLDQDDPDLDQMVVRTIPTQIPISPPTKRTTDLSRGSGFWHANRNIAKFVFVHLQIRVYGATRIDTASGGALPAKTGG